MLRHYRFSQVEMCRYDEVGVVLFQMTLDKIHLDGSWHIFRHLHAISADIQYQIMIELLSLNDQCLQQAQTFDLLLQRFIL